MLFNIFLCLFYHFIKFQDLLIQQIPFEHLHNNLKLLIEGHTDGHGVSSDNQNLSMQRAQHVARISLELGVSEDRVQASGLGSAFASGLDQQDRRVTVRWVLD